MLQSLLPSLMLKERPVVELVDKVDCDVVYEKLEMPTLLYIRRCTGGKVTVNCKVTKVIIEDCTDIELAIAIPLISGNLDIIRCSAVTLMLSASVPVVTSEHCLGCHIHLFREEPRPDFQLLSIESQGGEIHEDGNVYAVPATSEHQSMTRSLEGEWTSEKVVRENGYQTTERERNNNLAREERDEKKFGEAMMKSLKISKGNKKGKPAAFVDASASFSSAFTGEPEPEGSSSQGGLSSGISHFNKKDLKLTSTKVTTVGDLLGADKPRPQPAIETAKDELAEFHDEAEVLQAKVKSLAKMMKKAKYVVAYTGAGISHSAGIATYRGPNGLWTRRDQGLPPPESVALQTARPTIGHMTLVGLHKAGNIKHVVSTNIDGLHRRSGLGVDDLSELHGNCYKENCKGCHKEYLRNFDCTAQGCRADHTTGRVCDDCKGKLVDNIVHFGESLPVGEITKATDHSKAGDLALVLGTSMKVSPACNLPEYVWKKPTGQMVIVNLQKTPYDKYSKLRIFGETDLVLDMLAKELGVAVSEFEA